jgi:hypothetical protein
MKLVSSLTVIVLTTLLLAEAGARVLHYFRPLSIFYDESYNRWRLPAGQILYTEDDIAINSHGFNDEEFVDKRSGEFRIVALGDSFAGGAVPYRHNYLTLLEKQLQAYGPYKVLNMGIPAIGPKDYLNLFVREGLALKPDMVLLSFFVGNDIYNTRIKPKDQAWWEHSYVLSIFYYVFGVLPHLEEQGTSKKRMKNKVYCDECPTFTEQKFLEIETRRSKIFLTNNELTKHKIDKAIDYLAEIKNICDRNDIMLLVILIPDEVQINKDLAQLVVQRNYQGQQEYWDLGHPNKLIASKLLHAKIQFLDLYQPFLRYSETNSEALYKPRNTHWNMLGNRLASDTVAEYLIQIHDL